MKWAEPSRNLSWRITPLAAVERWPRKRRLLMLHSGRSHPRWARWSLLASPAGVFRFTAKPGEAGRSAWEPLGTIGADVALPAAWAHHPLRDLRRVLDVTRDQPGVWLGYLSYDLGRWIERLPVQAVDDRGWPLLELAYCPGFLLCDSDTHQWRVAGSWATGLPADLEDLPQRPVAPAEASDYGADVPHSVFSPEGYQAAVQRVLEYIAAGDVFQVNLAQRFSAPLRAAYPSGYRALFRQLATRSPAWYGGYLETGSVEHPRVLASTSPELFLELDPVSRSVTTRPIKGTRPAQVPAAELRESVKDQAELNMIVDLLRNDLGRVCAYGSMRVPEPRTIESHPTVHHGVATITGRLHEQRDVVDLLRATMPGGSITGAPKVRAMQIIEELEPVRRGPYCGAIGLLRADAAVLNIAIRTLQLDVARGLADFSVGGGIVADSDPSAEHAETLDKAAAMLAALRGGEATGDSCSDPG